MMEHAVGRRCAIVAAMPDAPAEVQTVEVSRARHLHSQRGGRR
jgi:hypothetical protein